MKIQAFNVGMLLTNCYVASCSETREAVIIDPGFDVAPEAEQIIRYVDVSKLKVKFIVNTHGHSDHISGNELLELKYAVPICIHAYDALYLGGLDENIPPTNVLLEDEKLLRFGQVTLKIMHTPGHTRGSVSLVGDGCVFTGDTLFAGGIGRTDFAGGSDDDMRCSLKKLLCLPDSNIVHPGHGPVSTIGDEKRFNPFLRWL